MASFDQIFDRFGNLVRSWVQSDSSDSDYHDSSYGNSSYSNSSSHFGDSDLDDAMEELDAFLNDDKEKQEQIRRNQEARQAKYAPKAPSADPKLVAAYNALGLKYGTDFQTVKSTYKKLLKEHHPDKHNGSAEELKKATEKSTRFNNAFRIIETWNDTGKVESD